MTEGGQVMLRELVAKKRNPNKTMFYWGFRLAHLTRLMSNLEALAKVLLPCA